MTVSTNSKVLTDEDIHRPVNDAADCDLLLHFNESSRSS